MSMSNDINLKIRGFTLIELIISIVILTIGATAFLTLIINTTKNSIDPVIRQQANAIAQSYLEEIMLNPFCDPDFDPDGDPTTGCATECVVSACSTASPNACGGPNAPGGAEAGRAVFDDICDYNGLPDTQVRDQLGNLIPGLGNYSVNVSVQDDSSADLSGLSAANGQIVRINVSVQHNNGASTSMSGYRSNF